ncbi:ketoacyl-ACP synthase III [Candidatus Acetothermia bacterium]|nr:ketoacyl-ACP synthase III [Candidatus Acetothermia bacterium]
MGIGILSVGSYLPERIMTNADWTKLIETSDEWITERTGIKKRHFAPEGVNTSDLVMRAAEKALQRANLHPQDLTEIIVATDTPELYTPDTAALVQHKLGVNEVPAYDLAGSGCAGFVQALAVAKSRVESEGGKILVAGVELFSRMMNWKDRNTCVLFGDGAGAAIVAETKSQSEILATYAGTDGSKADILGLEIGGTRRPITAEMIADPSYPPIVMKGKEVFREAVVRMSQAARVVLEKAQVSLEDISLIIPHQANIRIIEAVANALEVPLEKVYVNVQDYGNTGSASVPIALDEALQTEHIRPGDLVLMTAFGAGFHWAAALVRL